MGVLVNVSLLVFPELFPREFLLVGSDYVHLGRADSAPVHARTLKLRINAEGLYRPDEELRRHSGVNKGAKKHVAADPGKTFKVGNLHEDVSVHHRFSRFAASNLRGSFPLL